MSVYDSNLLEDALSIIGYQTVSYYSFAGRTTNSIGLDVASYAPVISISGSVQAVPRHIYEKMGLDFQANYVTLFLSKNSVDIQRDVSGDLFDYNGKRFQVLSKTDWFGQNDWVSLLAVQISQVIENDELFIVQPEDGPPDDMIDLSLTFENGIV